MSSAELMIQKPFPVRNVYGFTVDSFYLGDDGYGAYFRAKRYPGSPKINGVHTTGSTRVIFKRSKSQIILKINRYFSDAECVIRYLADHSADITYSSDVDNINIIDSTGFSIEDVLNKYSMAELVEYQNNKKYKEVKEYIKPAKILRIVPPHDKMIETIEKKIAKYASS